MMTVSCSYDGSEWLLIIAVSGTYSGSELEFWWYARFSLRHTTYACPVIFNMPKSVFE